MAVALIILAVLQVVASYFCAKYVYGVTRKRWMGVLLVLMSSLAPFSFGVFRNSLKCTFVLDFLCNLSHFWLGFILYFFLSCCCALFIHKIAPKVDVKKLMKCCVTVTLFVLLVGFINAMNPQLKRVVVPANVNLRICFISDIHVGSIGTTNTLKKISNLIELLHPDLVILGGDILDLRGLRSYREKFLAAMCKITSKYKTYAVVGNHEVYSGLEECINLLKNAGITVLLDEYVKVNGTKDDSDSLLGKVTIIGRLDSSILGRKSLEKIINSSNYDQNQKSYIIVVDHSPESLDESINCGVFLQLSGHTHGGQLFPLNFLTKLLYKETGILHKDNNTYSYISSGAGFWGPPYRVGNIPEVVLVELKRS